MSEPTPNESVEQPLLPPQVAAWVDRIVSVWRRLPIPFKLFIGAAVVTGILIASYYSLEPMFRDDAVLYSKLESEDAGAIVEKLKTQNVPYELTGDGTTIRVPKDRVHELRLALASEGLPRGGQIGFESFENMRLGATEFEQHVTYRRAMEGELARTITTIGAVRSARVHLVMPRKSVFAQKREPASASVVVKLAGGTLRQEEVQGVINMVASAVPGLEPDSITLVTTEGTMLHRPRPGGDEDGLTTADADQIAQTRALEAMLEERTRTMLERVLGPGHVDVRVSADLDTAKVERKSDLYTPDKTAMRSEQAMEERVGGGAGNPDTVAGVPGAEANLPGGEAIVGEAGEQNGAGVIRKSHTRNFEVDRVQERRVSVTQDVKRLAVAVVIDGKKEGEQVVPRTDEELAKLEELVKSAVGFDKERGDQLTVASVPFFIEQLPEEPVEPDLLPIPEPYKPIVDKWLPLAKVVGGVLLGLIVFLYIRRKVKKAVKVREKRMKELKAAEAAKALLSQAEAPEEQVEEETEKVDFRVEALGRAQSDPATAALVLRHWLQAAQESAPEKAA